MWTWGSCGTSSSGEGLPVFSFAFPSLNSYHWVHVWRETAIENETKIETSAQREE